MMPLRAALQTLISFALDMYNPDGLNIFMVFN
uniref:Uncharacterized protein n=1 Tax=Anguilla anguilla TaxID=7936 RepID=A0A0E9RNG7_ANGAN